MPKKTKLTELFAIINKERTDENLLEINEVKIPAETIEAYIDTKGNKLLRLILDLDKCSTVIERIRIEFVSDTWDEWKN